MLKKFVIISYVVIFILSNVVVSQQQQQVAAAGNNILLNLLANTLQSAGSAGNYDEPLRRGVDSRIGLGYRLGNAADFQVMLEVGPQIFTEPMKTQRARPPITPLDVLTSEHTKREVPQKNTEDTNKDNRRQLTLNPLVSSIRRYPVTHDDLLATSILLQAAGQNGKKFIWPGIRGLWHPQATQQSEYSQPNHLESLRRLKQNAALRVALAIQQKNKQFAVPTSNVQFISNRMGVAVPEVNTDSRGRKRGDWLSWLLEDKRLAKLLLWADNMKRWQRRKNVEFPNIFDLESQAGQMVRLILKHAGID